MVQIKVILDIVQRPKPVSLLLWPETHLLRQHQLLRKHLINHTQPNLHIFLLSVGLLRKIVQTEPHHMKVDVFRQFVTLIFKPVRNISKERSPDFLVAVERIVDLFTEIHQAKSQIAAIAK